MADEGWEQRVNELTARALVIAEDPASSTVRADTSLGMGQHQRGLTFGIIATLLEELDKHPVALAPEAEPPEVSALKQENAALREQLQGPFVAAAIEVDEAGGPEPEPEYGSEEGYDPALDVEHVAYEDLTPAQKRRRTMAAKEEDE